MPFLGVRIGMPNGLGGAGKPKLWTPANDTGLILWMDPADNSRMTMNGSNVSSYATKGSSAIALANPTSAQQPVLSATGLNSKPAFVTSANTQGLFNLAISLAGPLSFISVANLTTNESGRSDSFFSMSDAGGNDYLTGLFVGSNTAANNLGVYYSSVAGSRGNAVYTTSSPFIYYAGHPSGQQTLSLNGRPLTVSVAYPPGTMTKLAVIGRIISGAFGGNAPVGAFGDQIITTDSSTVTMQKYEGWLAWKYGLAALLPSTHPYALRAPYVNDAGFDLSQAQALFATNGVYFRAPLSVLKAA